MDTPYGERILRKLHVVGLCPACGEIVYAADDCVWVCPRDLSASNPYWQPSDVTEATMERAGVYSLCYDEHGGYCDDHMPLHGACYDAGAY